MGYNSGFKGLNKSGQKKITTLSMPGFGKRAD
jgi:hypothetical protein